MSELKNPTGQDEIEVEAIELAEEAPPPLPAAAPSPAVATAAAAVAAVPAEGKPLTVAEAQERIAFFDREAKALGLDPAAARLHHAIGRLWEEPLKTPRNAALSFQNAHRIAPKYVPNLQAARRLFAQVGNWQMVAQLLEAEAASSSQEARKIGLWLEKASILEDRLSRADEALSLLQQLEQRFPENIALLEALEAAYAARGQGERLHDVYLRLARAVTDPALKAHYLVAAGLLCEGPLGQPGEAATHYREAFALRKDDPILLAAIKRCAEREGNPDELLAALAAEAQAAGPAAAALYHRMARVLDRLGRPADALDALLAGRKVAPDDALLLDDLARHFETAQRWEDLADVLRARVERLSDPAERIALNLRLGEIDEERLGREELAIQCYQAVLAVAPGHPAASTALGKLYHRKKLWEELLKVLDGEIATSEDCRSKAAKLYKAAELLETRLTREDDAVARYREALAAEPGYLPALKALGRLYERRERWDDLIALVEQDLKETRDRDGRIAILTRVADLYEDRKSDLHRAAATLQRILEFAPDHLPTIRNLARVCERAGLWDELLQANELEASLAGDSKQVIALLHRNAEILEEQLKQKDKAIAAYQKVLTLAATYLPALRALGRLYAQEGRWADLVAMYRQEAEITPSPEQAASLLFKAAELQETKLQNLDDAIAGYQEVLTLAPVHFPALRALTRIYRAQQSWEHLVEVLRAEAAARTDKAERAHTLFQAGVLWEEQLARPDLATETYLEVLSLVPDHGPAFHALERLHERAGAFRELASLYERTLGSQAPLKAKVAAWLKLARLCLERLQEPSRAAECYQAVLDVDSSNLAALKGLESLRGDDRLKRAEVRSRLGAALADGAAAASVHLAAIRDRAAAGSPEATALAELKRIAELAPADPRAADELEKALAAAGDWAGLATWLEARAAREAETDQRAAVLLQLGEIFEWRLGLFDRALGSYRAVLELEPQQLPALRACRRVLAARGAHAECQQLLTAEAQACHDAAGAIELLIEAGSIAERDLQDDKLARAAYQAVLARDPLEARASQRLEHLLAKAGGQQEIAALHLKRAQTKAAGGDSAGGAGEYLSAAKIFAGQLRDGEQALAALDQALVLAPQHGEALRLRGDLCYESSRWPEAAQAYGLRVELGGDPRELAPLHHRLGILFQEHLGDPGRATPHFQTALVSEPGNLDALERLGNIYLASLNWTGAADAYRRLIEQTTDAPRLSRHLQVLGRISEQGMGDLQTAAAHYKRALDLTPDDGAIVDRLAEIYERLQNLEELVGLIDQQAVRAASGGDKARAMGLRMKSGELNLRLGDQVKAVQAYRFAVELAPDQLPPRVALADLLTKDPAAALAAIEEHRNLLKLDPCRVESYHVLYRLYANSRQLDKAVCTGHALAFFKALTEAETASFGEARGRAPVDTSEVLSASELDSMLQHPSSRHVLAELMRIVGDQLHKVYEPNLEGHGVGRGERLKADHQLHKVLRTLCTAFGVEKFEVYLAKQGSRVALENTDPLSIIIGGDLVRRYKDREQRFLLGRAAYGLRNKLALSRLGKPELEKMLGAAVRAVLPDFKGLGPADAELSKRIRKAMSGKALRQLEQLAPEVAQTKSFDLAGWLQGSALSADRAGLLVCGDLSGALQLLYREDSSVSGVRLDTPEHLVATLRRRRDMLELLGFLLSEDHFRLRAKLRLNLA